MKDIAETTQSTTTIEATIDGVKSAFRPGITILEAARSLGIEVPTLCDDTRLKPCGACRMCLVEIRGHTRNAVSCETPIAEGMEIQTHSEVIEKARAMNLRMLAQKLPSTILATEEKTPFSILTKNYGLTESDFHGTQNPALYDDSHPYIRVNMSHCIQCFRCVRICDEVQGQFVWKIADFAQATHIVHDGKSFRESSCVSCGACVDTCPTGALEDKSILKYGVPTAWTKTVCPYCGTGCEMNVGVRENQVVQIKPSMNATVSRGHLCLKGRYAFEFVDADDRVTEPMIRENGNWRIVSWTEAIDFASTKLKQILKDNGARSVAVLGSARATNEENYLAQKFARVVFENNNVDCCARVCHTPTAAAMKLMFGTGAATNSFDDIELARSFLICGANPTENHPIPGARIKQAVLHRGAKLVVIDPREIELTKYADIHLQISPGTNIPILNALAHVIIEEELFDKQFISERVSEFEEFREFVKPFTPENAARICGVDAGLIRRAARIYAGEKPSMCFHGLGITEHLQGTEGVMCVANLALLTGNIGKRGSGVNPLRGQNNVQGAAHMGCDPGILTGSISLNDGRESFERVWRAPVPKEKGLNLLQMMDAAENKKLKALWAIGYDVYLTNANANKTKEAFRSLELLIVQDLFLNETAREFAHVFFPVVSSFEKDGTFMNSDRHVQRIRKVVEPRGNSRSDWEVICELARAMGKGEAFSFETPEEIWNEIREVWSAGRGISYPRIENESLQWNCFDENDPGTSVLHQESFAKEKRAALRRIEFRPTPEIVSDEFPLLLNTGRSLFHFNSGTMTMRTPNTQIRPKDLLTISWKDAEKLSLDEGEIVRLISHYGEATLPIHIGDTLKEGELFATFHSHETFLNRITSPVRDRLVSAPEYKVTAVRIEKTTHT